MAEIAVNFLLEKLHATLVNEAQLLGGIRPGIEEIMQKLEIMKAFLKDADRKRDSRETIKTWVNQVRRAAYEMEDVIDEFVLRSGTRRHESDGIMNRLRALLNTIRKLPAKHNLANRIQDMKSKIIEMEKNRHEYDIERIEEDDSLENATIRRWQDHGEANFIGEAEIVGIEKDVKLLTQQLVGTVGGKDLANRYHFISVVGMGGLGKTTLVRKVYKEAKVKEHFNCSAWVSVSQTFDGKNLLKSTLTDFCKVKKHSSFEEGKEKTSLSKEDIDKMSVDDLKMELQKYLEGKKFILVLNDVWDRRVWDYLKLVLPKNSSGSKIIITTRIRSVASALETPENTNFVHELKTLSDDVAMELLCQKAFPRNSTMPLEFEEVSNSMLQRCGGLPLAIVALGGILYKKKSLSEWKKVNDNLRYQLDNDCSPAGSITGILRLSYNELPLHLKACFLYCGLFPEDHLIQRNRLIRLWVAEGFIEERNGDMTMEEAGEEYMMQLIDRSMLQVGDTSVGGNRVKSCKIHDLMRDLAISISQEEEFFFKLDKQAINENVMKGRRMCVLGENEENYETSSTPIGDQHMRSLLFFDAGYIWRGVLISNLGKFRLLRVLDLADAGINKLPEHITQLLHLRYLSLRRNVDLKQLPRSIGRLLNLQTLDIKLTGIRKLPNGIVRLRNLRHLCMSCTSVPLGIGDLRRLQTLTGVDGFGKEMVGEIGKLKELRRLKIYYLENKEVAEELYAAIRSMTHLFSLTISPSLGSSLSLIGNKLLESPPPNLRIIGLNGLPDWPLTLGSFNNLISLSLRFGFFGEDPFPSLSSLPSLLSLEFFLLDNIERLQCGPRGFPKLQRLGLHSMSQLETVRLEEGSMPNLKHLQIKNCDNLQMVPQGIEHLQLLQELLITNMPEEFIERLKEGGEDRARVQRIPLVTRRDWDDESNGYVTKVLFPMNLSYV